MLRPHAERIRQEIKDSGDHVLVDGCLVPVANWKDHTGLYSGKHKTTGQNVQLVSTLEGTIADVGQACPGATLDAKAFHESGVAQGWQDRIGDEQQPGMTGYKGCGIVSPRKKPRGGRLSEQDKQENQVINRRRAHVERAIAHFKNWKVLSTGYRHRLNHFPQTLQTVTSLEFYRTCGLVFE